MARILVFQVLQKVAQFFFKKRVLRVIYCRSVLKSQVRLASVQSTIAVSRIPLSIRRHVVSRLIDSGTSLVKEITVLSLSQNFCIFTNVKGKPRVQSAQIDNYFLWNILQTYCNEADGCLFCLWYRKESLWKILDLCSVSCSVVHASHFAFHSMASTGPLGTGAVYISIDGKTSFVLHGLCSKHTFNVHPFVDACSSMRFRREESSELPC